MITELLFELGDCLFCIDKPDEAANYLKRLLLFTKRISPDVTTDEQVADLLLAVGKNLN